LSSGRSFTAKYKNQEKIKSDDQYEQEVKKEKRKKEKASHEGQTHQVEGSPTSVAT